MTSPLDQISQDDKDSAKKILIDYMLQSSDRQKQVVYSIAYKIGQSLGVSKEDALICAGIAIRDAAATTAIAGQSLDTVLLLLNDNFDAFAKSAGENR